jgi:tRNA dimethylallyltransferase
MSQPNCIVVLGPTASGKTRLACLLAYYLNGEIISADSRQVYKFLDIGTGKDLDEYLVNGKRIPHYGINVAHPQEQFYLHQFMEELNKAFHEIRGRNNLPIICGGTGLYLDALRKDFSLTQVKENECLRRELLNYDKQGLINRLDTYPDALTKQVDRSSVKRLIRGIEIAEYCLENKFVPEKKQLPYRPYYIGITPNLTERKQRISERLKKRFDMGLIGEVKKLLDMGISPERLELLGLEYKFVLRFLQNRISWEELFQDLQTAIFQFARRQMTWFRKMEKEGVVIHWIDPEKNHEALIGQLKTML